MWVAIPREEARKRGLKTYFTGVPCKRGHVAERSVSRNFCSECNREKSIKFRSEHPEKAKKAVSRAWGKYAERYKHGHNQATRSWRANNPEAAKAIRGRSYAKGGKERGRIAKAKRRAMQKQQMPSWASMPAIAEIYRKCPKGQHVDHVIPLRGRLVSGLHVEYNLQYLPARENQRKHNFFNVEEH